jgi:hypothetical protein
MRSGIEFYFRLTEEETVATLSMKPIVVAGINRNCRKRLAHLISMHTLPDIPEKEKIHGETTP